MFRFRQFTVHDERCAMKVGTDGTLLGAWCPLPNGFSPDQCRVLDIGTGSGLIALMLAQRWPEATIVGIDIDAEAVAQANDNFAASPWSDRLSARHLSLQQLAQQEAVLPTPAYSLIVSNPPYFVDSLKNPDQGRKTARHTDTLSYSTLLRDASHLLLDDGLLSLILPAEAESTILSLAPTYGLTPIYITRVYTKPGKPCKRLLISLVKRASATLSNNVTVLTLLGEDGSPRSADYQRLCADFYL